MCGSGPRSGPGSWVPTSLMTGTGTPPPCYVGQDLVKLVIVHITLLTHSSSSSVAAWLTSLISVSSSVASFMVSTFIERNLMEARQPRLSSI